MQLQVLITYSGRIRITGTMLYVANQIRSICSTLANLKPINMNKIMKKLEGKVAVITEKARDLVLKVIGDGWQDSPFDPFWFAEYRHLTITPRDDIPNARLISKSLTGVTVEFDANEPEAKVYFSLAHEIGQVLFPDFGLTFRNRIKMSKRDFSDQARKFRAMIYE